MQQILRSARLAALASAALLLAGCSQDAGLPTEAGIDIAKAQPRLICDPFRISSMLSGTAPCYMQRFSSTQRQEWITEASRLMSGANGWVCAGIGSVMSGMADRVYHFNNIHWYHHEPSGQSGWLSGRYHGGMDDEIQVAYRDRDMAIRPLGDRMRTGRHEAAHRVGYTELEAQQIGERCAPGGAGMGTGSGAGDQQEQT